jgi:hypothetical protein
MKYAGNSERRRRRRRKLELGSWVKEWERRNKRT